MQSLFVGCGLLVEKQNLPRRPLEIHMPLYIESGKRCEYAGGSLRIRVLVADLDKVRLLQRINIQTARQLANRMFYFGRAVELRRACRNKPRHFDNLLEQIFVAQELDFGIEFFLGNVGPGEIHGAGRLGGDDGVITAPAQQNLEVRFIARRKDHEEHRCHQDQPKCGSDEPRTPEQRGREFAGSWREKCARVSVQFRGHGS
jgi:hypothetical protein